MATSSLSLLESLTPILQGAEAVRLVSLVVAILLTSTPSKKVYQCQLHGPSHPPLLLKHRFAKQYRHPTLDKSLTKGRVAGEARMLLRCLRNGVRVPGVRMVDVECGILGLEWIEGRSVRNYLGAGEMTESDVESELEETGEEAQGHSLASRSEIVNVMSQIGVEIARMHLADVIHGDLTTSNMMIRSAPLSSIAPNDLVPELVLIDFGLSFVSNLVEDKAVDLYVLERAFASTHPDSKPWFDAVLESYGKQSGKAWAQIYRRLESVRLRGRKRSMVG